MLRLIVSVAALLATTAPLAAQPPTASPNQFAPLEFLVGHCWRGTFPDGKQTDEHCFEWVFDQKFIRDRHSVRGGAPYGGETIYSWDPVANRIAFTYWNTVGQMMLGRVESASGDTLTFTTHLTGPQGDTEIRSSWVRRGSDGYLARALERSGKEWKEAFSIEMTRVR